MVSRTLLVWKYFFQQKYEEIVEHSFGIFMASIGIVYGLCMGAFIPEKKIWWLAIIAFIIAGFWLLLAIICIIRITCEWIHDNWKLANKRADKELKFASKQEGVKE